MTAPPLSDYVAALIAGDSWADTPGNRDALGAACTYRWNPPADTADLPDGASLAGDGETVLAPWAFASLAENVQAFHDLMGGNEYAVIRELGQAGRSTGDELLGALNATRFGYTDPGELAQLTDAEWSTPVPESHPNPPAPAPVDEWAPPAGARDVFAVRVDASGAVSVFVDPSLEAALGGLVHTIDWQGLVTAARQDAAPAQTETPTTDTSDDASAGETSEPSAAPSESEAPEGAGA